MHSLNFHETFRFRWHIRYWNFSPILMFIIANSWSFQYLEYNQGPLQNTHWYFPVAWLISCLAAWGYYKFGLSLLKSICLEICRQHEEKMIWKKKNKKKIHVCNSPGKLTISISHFLENGYTWNFFCQFLLLPSCFSVPQAPLEMDILWKERICFAGAQADLYRQWGKIIFDS